MYAFMHRRGVEPCGQPVFYLAKMPEHGEHVTASKILDAKGARLDVKPGERIRCLSCKKLVIGALTPRDIVEVH